MIRTAPVAGPALPNGFAVLRAEARAEGYNHMDRLAEEWSASLFPSGADCSCAQLFVACVDEELAGVGGFTPDPYDRSPGLVRMRRFYVRPLVRRAGIGTRLAQAVLSHAARQASRVALRAPDGRAARFWEALGFRPDAGPGRTHVKTLLGRP